MSHIFTQLEITALTKYCQEPLDDEQTVEQLDDLGKALTQIKQDYETHDALLRVFGEAEGYVMPIAYLGTYLRKRTDSVEPPYLRLELNLPNNPKLYLLARHDRQNSIFLGHLTDYQFPEGGAQTVVEIYVPDQNIKKILLQVGKLELTKPEKFAERLLVSRAEVELTIHHKDDESYFKNREWRGCGYRQKAKLAGTDLIAFYKSSVEECVREQGNIDAGKGGWSSQIPPICMRFLNRNHYPNKRLVSKVYGFKMEPMYL